MAYKLKTILFILISLFLVEGAFAQKKRDKKKKDASEQSAKSSKKDPKTIAEFLKKDVVSDDGLFTVHQQEGKHYFEIPSGLLGQDVLLVSRIAKIPSNLSPYLNAGSKVGQQLVIWEKQYDKILLRTKSYSNVADESDPIHISVENNNFQPIIASFKIEAYSKDSSSFLIQADPLFTKDIKALSGLSSRVRKSYKVKNLDKERSMIESIKSFPINVEVKHVTTFNASEPPAQRKTETLSLLMNQSFILLPVEKMQKRIADERVGWFTFGQIDYSSDKLKSDEKRYIRRWKLIPKDIEAYKRGELVEPEKPIVYYLDPATPQKWRKYFIQGIEDWNACFETAGFKNAIMAKEAPTPEEDPDFSPEDARYSVVRYVASTTRNAVGPSVSDPRTGEIIESDIIWYHNHLRSYRNRYLLETGAANPLARTLDTPEAEIGEMMRRVISHEIGHALGLPHNMKASAAYPVDSLRDGAFTQKYGIATTIMDYARYNYVAQPGDKNIRFVRQIGPYDHYAINYGYRYIPEASTEEEEKILNTWIAEKAGDKKYMFGGGYPRFDPNSLTENIGDDNVKASEYGLKNLRIVGDNLIDWTTKDNEDYSDLEELYGEYLGVWRRYTGHVIPLIGGVNETLKTKGQEGEVYAIVNRARQKEALNFLTKEVFSEQKWLIPDGISGLIAHEGLTTRVMDLQARQLKSLMNKDRLIRMLNYEKPNSSLYSVSDLFLDLQTHFITSKLSSTTATDRRLQREWIAILESFVHVEKDEKILSTDISAMARNQLKEIQRQLQLPKNGKSLTAIHYADLYDRIEKILSMD